MVRRVAFVVNFEKSVVEALLADFAPRIVDESLECCWPEGDVDRPTFSHFQRVFQNAAARRDSSILVLAATPEVAPGWLPRQRIEEIAGSKAVPIFHDDPTGTEWVRQMLNGFFPNSTRPIPPMFIQTTEHRPLLCVEPIDGLPSLQGMIRGCFPTIRIASSFRPVCPGTSRNELLITPDNYSGLLYCRSAAPNNSTQDIASPIRARSWKAPAQKKSSVSLSAAGNPRRPNHQWSLMESRAKMESEQVAPNAH